MLAGATIDKCKYQLYQLVYICVSPCKSGSCGASLCTHSFISMQFAYICQCLQLQLSICNFHLLMLAGATIHLPFTFVNGLPSSALPSAAAAAQLSTAFGSSRCPQPCLRQPQLPSPALPSAAAAAPSPAFGSPSCPAQQAVP